MNHFANSARNFFTASPIDRLGHKRTDAAWMTEQLSSESSRFLPIWQGKNLLANDDVPHPIMLSVQEVAKLTDKADPILLGSSENLIYFALPINTAPEWLSAKGHWEELRFQASLLPEADASLAVIAKALVYWHKRHAYCGDCGQKTLSQDGGYVRICTNDSAHKHFPRTDPAIIVLVFSGDKCLLARQPNWPEGRYSTLAGFVEPGESIEDAVVREVAEESNIDVGQVYYHSSQPWPFPSSLMVGYLAEATSTEIALLDQELEHAAWFSRTELIDSIKAGSLKLPPEVAISFSLIEAWFNQAEGLELRSILEAL